MRNEMGDWIDDAVHLQEQLLEVALNNRPPPLPTTTVCRNCRAPLHDRVNYCDEDCRDDHDRRAKSHHRTLRVLDDE